MRGTGRFLDSNILLYLLSENTVKADRAEALVREGGVISVQVLNESASVMRRKLGFAWPELGEVLESFEALLTIRPLTLASHQLGRELAAEHAFSLYDAMILASALLAGCDTLYSEDMQHGQLVRDQLRIVNPFARYIADEYPG